MLTSTQREFNVNDSIVDGAARAVAQFEFQYFQCVCVCLCYCSSRCQVEGEAAEQTAAGPSLTSVKPRLIVQMHFHTERTR